MSIKFIESSGDGFHSLEFGGVCFSYHFDSLNFEVSFLEPFLYFSTDFVVKFNSNDLVCSFNNESGEDRYAISTPNFFYIFPNFDMLSKFIDFSCLDLSAFLSLDSKPWVWEF